jgi:hypothetical protein
MRKTSQRIADKVVESTNSHVTAAIDHTVILFIADSPARLRPKARREWQKLFGYPNIVVWAKPVAAICYHSNGRYNVRLRTALKSCVV